MKNRLENNQGCRGESSKGNTDSERAQESDEANDSEIRGNVREALEEMRECVAVCGYRWDYTQDFLALIDSMIGDTENAEIETVGIVKRASKVLRFQADFMLFDEGESVP